VEEQQLRWKNNPKLFFFGRMIAFDLSCTCRASEIQQ
jgi:hypothetical protein